jgi:hypothetical protein
MSLPSSMIESHWSFTHQLDRSPHLPSRCAQQATEDRTTQFCAPLCSCARIPGRIPSHPLTATHPKTHITDQDVVRQAARAPNRRSRQRRPICRGSGLLGLLVVVRVIRHTPLDSLDKIGLAQHASKFTRATSHQEKKTSFHTKKRSASMQTSTRKLISIF